MEPLRADPVMAALMDEHGPLSIEPAGDMFERLVHSIINQQLSSASAAAIRGRLHDLVEVTPDGLLAASDEALRETGLSRQKIEYIRNVAKTFEANGYSVEYFDGMSDEAVIDELTAIKGIGVWTSKMFLMFCLGREDVFPVEDLGIRRGMELLYDLEERDAMVEKASEWAPYRSYASRYVWRAYE
jgi:DNA-3-methyladenine glycosylase II